MKKVELDFYKSDKKPDKVKKNSTASPPLSKKASVFGRYTPNLTNEILAWEITTKKAAKKRKEFNPGKYAGFIDY